VDAVRLAAAADGSTACGLIALRLVDACVAIPNTLWPSSSFDTVVQQADVIASGSQCCCYIPSGPLGCL